MIKAPEIVLPRAVDLPPVEVVVLDNGLRVHLIQNPEQNVARLSLVWAAGSAVQQKPFAASTTLNLLAEGSSRFSAHEIAEQLDFVGSYFDVSLDRDYAVMTFCWLERFFRPTLDVVSEIVLRPAFPAAELDIYARKRMERLALERAKPSTRAREAFTAALFGPKHPYGISSPEEGYLKLRREDVLEFWQRFYGADNCFAVCSLGASDEQKQAVLQLLGGLPPHPSGTPPLQGGENLWGEKYPLPEKEGWQPQADGVVNKISIPGAVQSAVRIGRVLFPRQHPDFVGMQVVATILGGYFGSRLVQNLREERGYTYGVMAAMVNLRAAGYLAISTEVKADATDDAVKQIFHEMERLRTELVTADELENVRRSMLGEVMRILDGPFGIVDVEIESIQLADERPEVERASSGCYLNDFIRQVEGITPERVRKLARKYLAAEEFSTVIVG